MSVAKDLVAAFEPWLTPDLQAYLESVGEMFREVEGWAEDKTALVEATNLITNPSGELDTAGWTAIPPVAGGTGAIGRDSGLMNKRGAAHLYGEGVGGAGAASAYVHYATALDVVPGDEVYLAVFAFASVPGGATAVDLGYLDQGGTWQNTGLVAAPDPEGGAGSIHRLPAPAQGEWFSGVLTVPGGVTSIRLAIRHTGVAAGAAWMLRFDAAMTVRTAIALEYFDGDSDGCRWLGKPHASMSFRPDASELGWMAMLDVDTCPEVALPLLGMFVGETLPDGITATAAREWIKDSPNRKRGTLTGIQRGAQRRLTGNRTVHIKLRYPDVDSILVVTYSYETPFPALTAYDLRHDLVPADLALDYSVRDGQSWEELQATSTDWDDVLATYTDWEDVRTTLGPGFATFIRPAP